MLLLSGCLDLSDNSLGLEGTIAVDRMLSSSHCEPWDVKLCRCGLTTTAGSGLPSTDSLYLGNTISYEAVGQQLCQCLKVAPLHG